MARVLVALRLDLSDAGGMLLGFIGEIANLEIDLLQFFERLQLLSRQRLPPSGPAFSPLRREMSTFGIGRAFRKNVRTSTDTRSRRCTRGEMGRSEERRVGKEGRSR